MKQIAQIFIVALVLISCSRFGNNGDQTRDMRESLKEVVGTWMITSKDEQGVIVHCNVCPMLKLNSDYSGEFVEVSKKAHGFTFDLKDRQIIFSNNDTFSYFQNETQFDYHIKDGESLRLMELESVKSHVKYFLAKSGDL